MSIGNRVADDEPLAASHILIPHGGEFHLTGSVQYVQQGRFAIDDGLLLVRVLNRRVVIVQKTVTHKLKRDGCKRENGLPDEMKVIFVLREIIDFIQSVICFDCDRLTQQFRARGIFGEIYRTLQPAHQKVTDQ